MTVAVLSTLTVSSNGRLRSLVQRMKDLRNATYLIVVLVASQVQSGLPGACCVPTIVSCPLSCATGTMTLDGAHAVYQSNMGPHRQAGIVAGPSEPCECREFLHVFLLQTGAAYGIDRIALWMIGDRESEVECSRAAVVPMIAIAPARAGAMAIIALVDLKAADIGRTASRVLEAPEWSSPLPQSS